MKIVRGDVPGWVGFLSKTSIPILKYTARELAQLESDENRLSARAIAATVLGDPFMVFRIISHAKTHQGKHQLQDLIQVEQAILMMGTDAFYQNLLPAPLVEDQLKDNMLALTHLLRLIKRAHRAAHYASDWAAMRMDLHPDEVRTAALLHDLAEMMLWCFAPDKMNTIFSMQQADSTLRSKAAQEEILGFRIMDLQKAMVDAFHLPPLLAKLMEDGSTDDARARNVALAVNLARHSAYGWDNAALPDDFQDIANLLHVDVERVKFLIGMPGAD
jgi:HD-like signal output (HDOD) protein